MSIFWISIGMGVATAAILALSSVAFTLEYAVSRVVNLAHGEVLTIGAYAAYVAETNFHLDLYECAIVATAAGCLAGMALNLTFRTSRVRYAPPLSNQLQNLVSSIRKVEFV